MALPGLLRKRLRLPVIGSPLFIISIPDLVIAQCKAGVVGSFPADFTVARGLAGWLLIGDDVRDDLVLAGDTQMVFVRPGAARTQQSSNRQ